jgi:hypothetical protein
VYKSLGYRFSGEEGTNVWNLKGGIPLAIAAEVEVEINREKPVGAPSNTEGPSMKVDEVEFISGGTLGKRGSFFAEVGLEPEDGEVEPEIGPVWGQINDLVGDQGELNVRGGQFHAELPFLSQDRRIVRNAYLAFDKLGFLRNEIGFELNGQLLAAEESGSPTHRYGGAVITGDANGDNNKFTRGYGWYNATLAARHEIGAIVQGGRDSVEFMMTPVQVEEIGAAAAGETRVGDVIVTGAYFFLKQHFEGNLIDDQTFHNLMLEALYLPNPRWVLGGRVDWLTETESKRARDDGWRLSALARYNVAWNLWVGGEYRQEEGGTGSPVTPNHTNYGGRLFISFAH